MTRHTLFLISALLLCGCGAGPTPTAHWHVADKAILSAALLPDSGQAVYSVTDGFANLWDIRAGAPRYTWQVEPEPASAFTEVAIADNGRVVALSDQQTLSIWSPAEGALMGLWTLPDIRAIALSNDGQYALLGLKHGLAQWLHLGTGSVVGEFRYGDDTNAVAIAPDRTLIITAGDDRKARLWSVIDGTLKAVWPHANAVVAAAFSPDGTLAVTNAANGPIRVWKTDSGQELAPVGDTGRVTVLSLRFDPGGRLLAVGTPSGRIDVFDMITRARVGRFSTPAPPTRRPARSAVADLRFLPDGGGLVSIDLNGGVQHWRL